MNNIVDYLPKEFDEFFDYELCDYIIPNDYVMEIKIGDKVLMGYDSSEEDIYFHGEWEEIIEIVDEQALAYVKDNMKYFKNKL